MDDVGWNADAGPERLRARMRDVRSGRVVYVAHCLLNENVRYLGGAGRPGGVREVIDGLQQQGVGVCQMPCPEQLVWGGVRKRHLLALFGAWPIATQPLGRLTAALLVRYTRWRYRRLARSVAGQMADYRASGFDVAGVIGIDTSPSCGVHATLDVAAAIEALGRCDPETIDAATFNRDVVARTRIAGEGMFMEALRRAAARRGLRVRFAAHDLMAELEHRPIPTVEL